MLFHRIRQSQMAIHITRSDAYIIIKWLVEIPFFDLDVIVSTISLVTDHHGKASKKRRPPSHDENSRYALEDVDDGKKRIVWEGNEAKRNAGKCIWQSRTWVRSYLDQGAANRRVETPFNVAGNPVFPLNTITELTLLFLPFPRFLSLSLFETHYYSS